MRLFQREYKIIRAHLLHICIAYLSIYLPVSTASIIVLPYIYISISISSKYVMAAVECARSR